MKLISHDDFIKLPAGIVYREYTPQVFGELKVKGDSISDSDWFYKDFDSNFYNPQAEDEFKQHYEYCEMLEKGKELKMEYDCQSRDGMFDYDRQFLIYDKKDVEDLIKALQHYIK